jgi:hypothetical protein
MARFSNATSAGTRIADPLNREVNMKKALIPIALLTLLTVSCKVEKKSEHTYEVTTPTAEEVKTATANAADNVADKANEIKTEAGPAIEKIKEGSKEAAKKTGEAARSAADATGKAVEKAGESLQEHSKPGNQP